MSSLKITAPASNQPTDTSQMAKDNWKDKK